MGDIAIKKVLFACLGNICRSPIAAAVFLNLVKQRNLTNEWHAESRATVKNHVGQSPDKRALLILQKHGITYKGRARLMLPDDFREFDFIFGMDENNICNINEIAENVKDKKAKIALLASVLPEEDQNIRDPYFDPGTSGFEDCYQKCLRCCTAFLDQQTQTIHCD